MNFNKSLLNFIFKEAKLVQVTLYSIGVKVGYK